MNYYTACPWNLGFGNVYYHKGKTIVQIGKLKHTTYQVWLNESV
jgi:hypothetical protein